LGKLRKIFTPPFIFARIPGWIAFRKIKIEKYFPSPSEENKEIWEN
jgi:citrate synthase